MGGLMTADRVHQPVLLAEALETLAVSPEGWYVDGTFGRGGHSRGLLDRLGSRGRLLVCDKDPEAMAVAWRLAALDSRVEGWQGSFSELGRTLVERGWQGRVNGILLDLGVSSPQLDDPRRGFALMAEGPLDMRMDPGAGVSAAEWLATVSVKDMARVFEEFGEERFAWRIAQGLDRLRHQTPLTSTRQLAAAIAACQPSRERGHPATRCFQAIRIHLNRELDELTAVLPQALAALAAGGRLAVIAFHSLEDRIVKRFFKAEARGTLFPKGVPLPGGPSGMQLKLLGRAIRPGVPEIDANPRARSAILRVAERLA